MAKVCKKCGAPMEDSDRFCTICGASVEMSFNEQPSNGAEVHQETTKEETTKYTSNDRTEQKTERKDDGEEKDRETLTLGNYLLLFLILAIPIVNIIFLLIWAFGKEQNINRKNFSRAALIYVVVTSLLVVIVLGGIFSMAAYKFARYQNTWNIPYVYEWDDDDWDVWTQPTPIGGHGICSPY